jgi:putative peptide zinc metalloprotease protein
VERVRGRPGQVAVTLAHGQGLQVVASMDRATPKASCELPSAALGDRSGGPLATDPGDRSGRTALEERFAFDLRLPDGVDARVGARALVSFEHGATHAGDLLLRLGRQTFLRHFAR